MLSTDSHYLGLGLTLFVVLCSIVLHLFNTHVTTPYFVEATNMELMENICTNGFDFSSIKLTSNSGLSLLNTGIHYITENIFGTPLTLDTCSISFLRITNVTFGVGVFYMIFILLRTLHSNLRSDAAILRTLTISMFPILFIYNYLYTPDVISLFFVLLTYYFSVKQVVRIEKASLYFLAESKARRSNGVNGGSVSDVSGQRQANNEAVLVPTLLPTFSSPYSILDAFFLAFFGLVSIFIQHTNIIWLLFSVITVILADFERHERWYNIRHQDKIAQQKRVLGALVDGQESATSEILSKMISFMDFIATNPRTYLKQFPTLIVSITYIHFFIKEIVLRNARIAAAKANVAQNLAANVNIPLSPSLDSLTTSAHGTVAHFPLVLYFLLVSLVIIDWQYCIQTLVDPLRLMFLPVPTAIPSGKKQSVPSSSSSSSSSSSALTVKSQKNQKAPSVMTSITTPRGSHALMLQCIILLIISLVMVLFVQKNTIIDSSLDTDTRFYIHYIWKYTLGIHHYIRLGMVAIYLFAFCVLSNALGHKTTFFRVIYLFSLTAYLITSPIIELRLFITPLILLAITQKPFETFYDDEIVRRYDTKGRFVENNNVVEGDDANRDDIEYPLVLKIVHTVEVFLIKHEIFLGVRFLTFALVNCITIYVFLFHPFVFNDGSIGRLSW